MQNNAPFLARRLPTLAAAALSITVLSACTPPRAPDAPKAQRVTTYACDRGPMLVVHWPATPEGPALLEMNGRTVALQPGGTYIRGKGNTMFYQAPRMVRVNCVAR